MKQIIEALIKAQGEFPAIVKDSVNPHFKNRYASLDGVLETVNPVLRKNGLVLIQTAEGDGLRTTLYHSSGEKLEGVQTLHPAKNDPQGYHGAQTYARRYGILGILGIASEDDDGNEASRPAPVKTQPAPLMIDLRGAAVQLYNQIGKSASDKLHAWMSDIDMHNETQLRNGIELMKAQIKKEGIK